MSVSGFFRTIILLGAIQGFITGSLLYFSAENRRSNRLLALLVWLMALASLNLYIDYTGCYYYNTTTATLHALVPMVIIMPLGPLIFFYIRSVLDPDIIITKKQRIHFLPLVIDLVPQLTALVFFIGALTRTARPDPAPWGDFIDTYNVYADIPRWISMTVYTCLSARHIRIYRTKKQVAPDEMQARIMWPLQLVRVFMIFQAIWLVYLIPYILPLHTNQVLDTVDWYPIYIPLSVLIYWLGIKGYIIFRTSPAAVKRPSNSQVLYTPETTGVIATLKKSMEEDKQYLDPLLSVHTLAQHTGLPPKTISAVINQHLQKNFNDFVNEYRLQEFKIKILNPDLGHLTIIGIATGCGFNSPATFQRVFKQHTGMTPSEFRKNGPQIQSR